MIGIFAASFMRAAGITRRADAVAADRDMRAQDKALLARLCAARRDRPVDWAQRQRLEAALRQHRDTKSDQTAICDSSAACRAV